MGFTEFEQVGDEELLSEIAKIVAAGDNGEEVCEALCKMSIEIACRRLGALKRPEFKIIDMEELGSVYDRVEKRLDEIANARDNGEAIDAEEEERLLELEDTYECYANADVLYDDETNTIEFVSTSFDKILKRKELLFLFSSMAHECRHLYQKQNDMNLVELEYQDYRPFWLSKLVWYASEDEADANAFAAQMVGELGLVASGSLDEKQLRAYKTALRKYKLIDQNKERCMNILAKPLRRLFAYLDEKRYAGEDDEQE